MKRSFFSDIAGRFPGLLAANVVVLLFVGLLDAASVLAVAPVVDSLLNPDPLRTSGITRHFTSALSALGLPGGLKTLLLCFLAFNVLSSTAYICARYLILRTKYAVSRDLLVGTFEDFFNARWQFFSGNEQGTLLNTFTREMGVVGDAFGAMAVFAANIIQISLFLAVPLWLSWQVTLLSLGTALLLAAPFLLLGRLNYRLGTENTRTANRLSSVIHESLTSAKVIMGFGSQDRCLASLDTAFEEHRRVTLKSQTLGLATPYLYQPLGLSVLIIAFFAAQRQGIPLSTAAVLLYSLLRVLPIIGRVAEQKNALDNFFPSYEQVKSLREQARGLRQAGGSRPFAGFKRDITFEGVVFAHPGRERALDGVSLKIPKGSLVALVGESGAGKSTLIDMLMGFHEPQAGSIRFDGVDLKEYDLGAYRRRLGYVPQDSLLFNLSIRDNLLWSQPDAGAADLERACRLAHAAEFIDQLPEGFATIVGDRGVRLSGGQIQRLALARAILRRPELLILDEATSALDSQSERLIQSAVEVIAKDTTIVVIAHRLSTIKNADHVYVLNRGRIVEEGRYADLIRQGGAFQKMAQLQVLETTPGGAA